MDSIKGSSANACPVDTRSPHFPGGGEVMMKFITKNLSLPDSVTKVIHQSRIVLKITIDTTGRLKDISVLKGVCKTFDDEMLRIFSIMPNWVPGIREGKKVLETFALPMKVNFDH